jgi:peroxiredoxin
VPMIQFAIVVALLILALIGAAGVFFLLTEVMKQQGRMLLVLDAIESRAGTQGGAVKAPTGLAVGTAFPSFRLPDDFGNEVTLEDLRGQSVLLVNWSPLCGFCRRIAPDIAELQDGFTNKDIRLVFAAFGDAGANRELANEHDLEGLLLLQSRERSLDAFKGIGTPAAYLLDEQGAVARPLAVGAEQVPDLMREVVAASPQNGQSNGTRALVVLDASVKKNGATIPKTEAGPSSGPGTELKRILARFGVEATPDCPCDARAAEMDRRGSGWCEQNIDTILGWLEAEASRRGMVYVRWLARFVVRRAIASARRADAAAKGRSASANSIGSAPAPGFRNADGAGAVASVGRGPDGFLSGTGAASVGATS